MWAVSGGPCRCPQGEAGPATLSSVSVSLHMVLVGYRETSLALCLRPPGLVQGWASQDMGAGVTIRVMSGPEWRGHCQGDIQQLCCFLSPHRSSQQHL